MARIRTIKPELWTSPQIVSCSPLARLAFIGLLNFCDDNGVHPASASRLWMQVFPEDDIDTDAVRNLVGELIRSGLVAVYLVGDEVFWCVTGWPRHQKIDRPTFRHPLPDGSVGRQMPNEIRRAVAEDSASTLVEDARRGNSSNSFVEDARRVPSTTEWNGVEWSKPPSHGEDSEPHRSTTEIEGGNSAAPKIPGRCFVARGATEC